MIAAWIALGATSAHAQSWSSFEGAFPMFPCQDGWMACIVHGARLDPDLRQDTGGPTDWRVGWFDLEPTALFSPFVGLSSYPAEPVVAPPPPRAKHGPKVLPPDLPVVPPPPVPGVADEDCADLAALEVPATLGQLAPDTTACLEARIATAKVTDQRRMSVLLLTDAWARGDRDAWEKLAERHLDQIDQSDPDLCYQFALYLSRQRPDRATDVIRWADVALENRMVWVGDTYTSRVYSLYKVRAAASQALWERAPAGEASERYRTLTKVNAREWYEYADRVGKDAAVALQLCRSAAGTSEYCDL